MDQNDMHKLELQSWPVEKGAAYRVTVAAIDNEMLRWGLITTDMQSHCPGPDPICRDFGDRIVSRLTNGLIRVNMSSRDLRTVDVAFGRLMERLTDFAKQPTPRI